MQNLAYLECNSFYQVEVYFYPPLQISKLLEKLVLGPTLLFSLVAGFEKSYNWCLAKLMLSADHYSLHDVCESSVPQETKIAF